MYSQSDKMWERAGKIMHFMLHRGAKASEIAPTLRLTNINPFDTNNKVRALVDTLTTLKGNAENIFNVHKHANNKRNHPNPNDNSYDPSVSSCPLCSRANGPIYYSFYSNISTMRCYTQNRCPKSTFFFLPDIVHNLFR